MCSELNLDSLDDRWDGLSFSQGPVSVTSYDGRIFSQEGINPHMTMRINQIAESNIGPVDLNRLVTVNTKEEWGDKDCAKVSVGASGGIQSALGYSLFEKENIKYQFMPLKNSVGGSVEANADTKEGSSVKAEVYVSTRDDDGGKVSIQAQGSITNDRDGNIQADGGIKISVEREF